MPDRTCSIDECDRPFYGRGWCQFHWLRWYRHGDTSYERPRQLGRPPCIIDGCDAPNVGRGWCSKHWTRWSRHGSPTARMPGEVVDGKRICSTCREDKPLDQFYADYSECRACCTRRMRAHRKRNPPPLVQTHPQSCDGCGATFPANKRRSRYCSRECLETFRHKANWINVVTRRARERDALVERFDRIEIFERDNWTCGICGDPVDPNAPRHGSRSRYPSIDHIIPISRGGEHSRANVQTACLGCNVRKGASVA